MSDLIIAPGIPERNPTPSAAHTPLRLSAGDETRIMDNKGYPLLDVKCGGMSGRTVKEGEQIAAFIVRACNSHYQLVDALREAIEELWDRDHSSMDRIQFERANASLFAALSQAGGE